MDRSLGKVVRALRLRLGWRQADLANRAGVSQRAISKLERNGPAGFTVHTLRRICDPLDVDLKVYGRWRGGELDRLLDAAHASLQSFMTAKLEAAGWLARAEVTFSRFGERGSVDLLAFHPGTSAMLIVEIKTVIADVQGLLRPIDIKVRLGRDIAAEQRWSPPRVVIPALVVPDNSTSRRRISQHAPLFSRFSLRGWAAVRWLRDPGHPTTGLLLFVSPSPGTGGAVSRAGRQRVRPSSKPSRSAAGRGGTTIGLSPR